MTIQDLKLIGIALLIVLSGCSGLGIDETNSTVAPPMESLSPSSPTPTSTVTSTVTPTPTLENKNDTNHTARLIRILKSGNITATKLDTPYRRGGEAWVGGDYGLSYEEFTTAALKIQEITLEEHSSGPGKKLVIKQTAYNDSYLAYTVNMYFLAYVDTIRQVSNSDQPTEFNQIEIKTYSPQTLDNGQPVEITRMTERQVFLYHLRPNEYTLKRAIGFINGQSRNIEKQGRQKYPVELKEDLEAAAEEADDNITIDRIEMQDKAMLITFTSDADPEDRAAWAAQSYFIFRTIGTAEITDADLPDRIKSINAREYSTHGNQERDLISYVSAGDETAIAYANGSVLPVEAASAIHNRTLFEDDRLNR